MGCVKAGRVFFLIKRWSRGDVSYYSLLCHMTLYIRLRVDYSLLANNELSILRGPRCDFALSCSKPLLFGVRLA